MKSSRISQRRQTQSAAASPDYVARRQEILRAAADIFKEKGYQATNVNDIARATKLDRATLYYYAGGKVELFQEIVQTAVTHNVEIAERLAASDLPAISKLERFIDEIAMSFSEHYPYMQTYWQEDVARVKASNSVWRREMAGLAHRFDQALIGMIAAGQADGCIRKCGEPRLLAYGIIGLLNSTHRWFKPKSGYTAKHIGKVFADVLISGLIVR